ncbi:MAG TPA: ribulose bisphosphate carboxylase small subunit [Solirubrobacter sp.]|nr:ribulose bisphosphate carboxylase small subunit [Solirubrobacter sp.]
MITQGAFSFLPALTDDQIAAQLRYAQANGWSILVERTDDPHPRNALWDLYGEPRFEYTPELVLEDVRAARALGGYVKVVGYDRSLGRQTTALSFIVGRPAVERAFRVERTELADRRVRYTLR